MPRLSPAVPLLAASLAAAACAIAPGGDEDATTSPTPASTTIGTTDQTRSPTVSSTGATTSPDPSTPATTGAVPDGEASACPVIERNATGRVQRVDLVETSGLAASRRHEGVLWAINDSGQQAGLYAFDHQGRDLGFFALVSRGVAIPTVDLEDLAILDGTLYLADIGDNAARRDTVVIHAVEEPDPQRSRAAGGEGGIEMQVEVEFTIELRYPDGPTDAEALVADPARGELILLSKDLDDGRAPTRIYTVPLGRTDEQVVEAIPAGEIDVAALTASSDGFSLSSLLFPGSVTGADLLGEFGTDDDLIALRTYGSVWLYRRPAGVSVAEALRSTRPCEVGSAAEQQGEAVAFLPPVAGETGSVGRLVRYVTVSEGSTPPINLSVAELAP